LVLVCLQLGVKSGVKNRSQLNGMASRGFGTRRLRPLARPGWHGFGLSPRWILRVRVLVRQPTDKVRLFPAISQAKHMACCGDQPPCAGPHWDRRLHLLAVSATFWQTPLVTARRERVVGATTLSLISSGVTPRGVG
jgi:hypothetical protein